jgi:hypothetical protein
MKESIGRILRLALALALVGVGPATRLADLLLFHGPGAQVAAAQVDDGSAPLPHADDCLLATPATPAVPAIGCTLPLVALPTLADRPAIAAVPVPATQAGRSPPSRAPPTLLS